MTTIQQDYINLNLTENYHQTALKFATEQDNKDKAKQVYLNTLVVNAVNDFITEDLGFTTDLENSYCYNIAVRCFQDVADILIPDLGRIECIILNQNDDQLKVNKAVTEDRIAYIAVELPNQTLNKVKLLGFYPLYYPQPDLTEIKLDQLTPIDQLIDHLFKLEMRNNDDDIDNLLKKIEAKYNQSPLKVMADLERILRNSEPYQWRENIINLVDHLVENQPSLAMVREANLTKNNNNELIDLEEELIEKLAEIWGIDEDY
jgi:hypothetical protein